MARADIPAGPDALTAAWLTAALRAGGALREASVRAFTLEPLGAGQGVIGQLARVRLEYTSPEPGAPSTLIAKFPSAHPVNRRLGNLFGLYDREARFYVELRAQVPLRVPGCHYAPPAGGALLLLEDLAPALPGDQVAGCSQPGTEQAVRALARLHAAWWMSPRLAEYPWLLSPPDHALSLARMLRWAWLRFRVHADPRLPMAARALGGSLLIERRLSDLLAWAASPPVTLVHGDYRVDNLFFGGAVGFAVADWQVVTRGRGAFDLAYFLAGSLPPAERRATEWPLLDLYYGELRAGGVRDYAFEQLWLDYRRSMLLVFSRVLLLAGTIHWANARGRALLHCLVERVAAAVVDLDVAALLAG